MGLLTPKLDPDRPLAANGAATGNGHSHVPGAISISLVRQDLAEALKLTAQGNQAALRRVYAATSVKLFGVIFRILGRRDLAEDVLQEVYIRVWERAGEFNPAEGSPIAWLVTIARKRALDDIRRTTTRPLDECPNPLDASGDGNPIGDHEQQEEHHRLLACLDRLGPDMKEVVVLAYYYGMTREEIARRTNRPVATVQAWLRQGLARVKDSLGQ